ncbi:alpha/beta hydrolase [uncultured Ferrimonas sp.]|uniref:alpha/beta hydrolase n=1 Tax=uncultured Ferrimonas sp. TaxID=432640 RepID=UPI002611AA79|nr:alpha/beta hydrolase [uncultured Ferrimonas sp.]
MNIEKWIVRGLLASPKSIQQLVLGQPPLQIDGRIMDLQMQLLSKLAQSKPRLDQLSLDHARTAVRQGVAMMASRPNPQISHHQLCIAGPQSPLLLRVYQPRNLPADAPAILYFHMGGFVVGDLDTNHDFCITLAKICNAKVYSLQYRKAPEHPFPAAHDDAFAAFTWLSRNAQRQGVDPQRIAVAGDSAGGAMSALLCQRLKRLQQPQPKVQLLVYPGTNSEGYGQSWQSCQDCYPLTMNEMIWFHQHFLGDHTDLSDETVAPMNSTDLAELAPAIVVTAGFDPLRDQGIAYGQQLAQAGVSVVQLQMDSLAHGFTAMAGAIDAAAQANRQIATQLQQQL